ncbi:MAG: translation elongation factor Ts [Candidatus Peregrinibacteria bacterium]
MSEISASAVMSLRNKLGISMMECKKALVEANGDEEQAVEILRKRGMAKASAKSDRETSEGSIAIVGKAAVKLLCETDFVARNDQFVAFVEELAKKANTEGKAALEAHFEAVKAEKMTQLGENLVLAQVEILDGDTVGGYVHSNKKVATIIALSGGDLSLAADLGMHATAMNPVVISPDEVSDELVEKEKKIWVEQLAQEGKPANIVENILKGKEAKFRQEGAFLEQDFVKNPEKKIKNLLQESGATLLSFVRLEV